jgi:tripartite-type tricarboxylate transporter receptor subunit TctC
MALSPPAPDTIASILIVAALAEELDHPDVLHTGVGKLNTAIGEIVKLPDVVERFKQLAANPHVGTPEAFAALVAREIPRWKAVAEKANIKPQ